jgi:hypothetical protein
MVKKQGSRTDQPKPAAPVMGGKVENDANRTGSQKPTQKNEGKRTPASRNDRDTALGSDNQTQSRKGTGAKR